MLQQLLIHIYDAINSLAKIYLPRYICPWCSWRGIILELCTPRSMNFTGQVFCNGNYCSSAYLASFAKDQLYIQSLFLNWRHHSHTIFLWQSCQKILLQRPLVPPTPDYMFWPFDLLATAIIIIAHKKRWVWPFPSVPIHLSIRHVSFIDGELLTLVCVLEHVMVTSSSVITGGVWPERGSVMEIMTAEISLMSHMTFHHVKIYVSKS